MDIVDWEKLWADFDEWHKGRHSNGTWEGQKLVIARLVEEQLRANDIPGFEGTIESLKSIGT